jgi:hypothetical protein
MYPLAPAERDYFAHPHLDPAQDRCKSVAERQRNQKGVPGYRNKGDPREAFVAG